MSKEPNKYSAHWDNTETMNDYLNIEMDPSWELLEHHGTMAIIMTDTGAMYEVHAGGDGDSFNHKVSFKEV